MQIQVHPLTNNPTAAWKEFSKTQKVYKINVRIPPKPVADNMVRFVCMSDTHSLVHNIKFAIPDGDVFLHAGDFTKCGHRSEVEEFDRWLETLPHPHKIVIGGNHELSFDSRFIHSFKQTNGNSRHTGFSLEDEIPNYGSKTKEIGAAVQTENIRQYLTNCTYLEDESIDVCGIKVYGTPWQPEFGNWAFNLPRGEQCLEKWNLIPEDTDVLLTHSPPVGHGDFACSGVRAGCVELFNTVQQRVKPKYHIFGHIHEGYGVTSDGKIIFINASTCDINYSPNNMPIVFDMPLPEGKCK